MFGFSIFPENTKQTELVESDVAGFVVLDKSKPQFKDQVNSQKKENLIREVEVQWTRKDGRLVRDKCEKQD